MYNNGILLCLHTARQLPVYGDSSYRAKKSQRERERERERERTLLLCIYIGSLLIILSVLVYI